MNASASEILSLNLKLDCYAPGQKYQFHTPRAKTINVFRAWIGAQLTICAQK